MTASPVHQPIYNDHWLVCRFSGHLFSEETRARCEVLADALIFMDAIATSKYAENVSSRNT